MKKLLIVFLALSSISSYANLIKVDSEIKRNYLLSVAECDLEKMDKNYGKLMTDIDDQRIGASFAFRKASLKYVLKRAAEHSDFVENCKM